MNCLRCGRETAEQQVFCNLCLDDMARHPVKSDTPIYLPNRKTKEPSKKQPHWQKRERTPEEMVTILRKRVRILAVLCVILFMMLAAAAAGVWFARQQGAELSIPKDNPNYQIITEILHGGEVD